MIGKTVSPVTVAIQYLIPTKVESLGLGWGLNKKQPNQPDSNRLQPTPTPRRATPAPTTRQLDLNFNNGA